MRKTLEELLHVSVSVKQITGKSSLPRYLTSGYAFFDVCIASTHFIAVEMRTDRTDIRKLKHAFKKYEDAYSCRVCLCITDITSIRRDAMIRAGIPFIAPPAQIYLPFLGTILLDKFPRITSTVTDKMSPTEQLLFLYLIYHNESFLKSQLAENLGVTRAAVTKVTEALLNKKLIIQKKRGKEVSVSLSGAPHDCYERAKEWLISPIKKKVFCIDKTECDRFLLAGESALSSISMLSPPPMVIRACSERDIRSMNLSTVGDDRWIDNDGYLMLEIWKYDPTKLSDSDTIDLLSLNLSLLSEEDERVQGELETLMEGYRWQ